MNIRSGTTGEGSTLDHEEHSEAIRFTVEVVNKRIPVIAATGVGLISTIVMNVCFKSAASVITTGVIGISDILSQGLLTQLVGNLVKIEAISLAGFQNGLIFTFVFLLVWTGAYYLIEIGEPKEEKKN